MAKKSASQLSIKNCLLGLTSIVKNSDKNKYLYSGNGIGFDGAGSWRFGNSFARNVVIFDVDNSQSSHTDNYKNNFLVLGEGPTDDNNGTVGVAEKNFSVNFNKAKTKFCLNLRYNCDSS